MNDAILSLTGVVLAAFFIWLTLRIVNRERWAKRMALVLVAGLPTLYVASFGPACWLTSQRDGLRRSQTPRAMIIYYPLGALAAERDTVCSQSLRWWMTLTVPRLHMAVVPTNAAGTQFLEVETPR